MQSFIDKYSWRAFLGPQSKNVQEFNEIYSWQSFKKNNILISRDFEESDLQYLLTKTPFSFHYFSEKNVQFLKKHFKVSRHKENCHCIDLNKFTIIGKKNHGIRGAINKNKKLNLQILDDYKKVEDVNFIINTWSESLADKYFRDFSGKNKFFLVNRFHEKCINCFVYDGDKLISFGILSPPEDNKSVYIIGKALCKDYPGLSEFTDYMCYKKAMANGIGDVNLGGASKGLISFKKKFPGSYELVSYNGSCNV